MTISDDSDDILHSGSGIKNIVIIDMTDMVGSDEVTEGSFLPKAA